MKVLLLCYFYPPMGGAGVQRALKFSRYLPELGVKPTVVCAFDPTYPADESLCAEVPRSVEVHRIAHTPLAGRWAARSRRSTGPAPPPGPMASVCAAARTVALGAWQSLQWPDDKALWAFKAWREGRRILRQAMDAGERFDLVFSSSPPASAHVAAARLASEFSLPWVADFRDLWTDNPAYAAPSWRRWTDVRLEGSVLSQASGIVTVTQTWCTLLGRRSGGTPVAFVPNGYDELDFTVQRAEGRTPDGLYRLTHTGTLYGPRDPSRFLEGVSRWLARRPNGHERFRLRLVGNTGARFDGVLAAFESRHPNVIERIAYVPHHEAIAEMVNSDALLLLVGGRAGSEAADGWLPGKIFEYLRARRPILLVGAPEGEAAAIVREHGAGLAVDDEDPAAVAMALERLLRDPPQLRDGDPSIARYERRQISRRLRDFMVECIERHE